MAHLSHEDEGANVATAILDLREFIDYAQEWLQRREEAVEEPATVAGTTVITDGMSELEFMEHTLQQLRNNGTAALVTVSDDEVEAMEEEQIGEHFSRYPFRY